MNNRCVIVGGGHAGAQLVASLRSEGWTGEIILVGEEEFLPYHRPPLSKQYLGGDFDAARMLIRPQKFYEDQQIELRLGVRVSGIDRDARRVSLDDGEDLEYDYLCLATGNRPRRLDDVAGADLHGIHYLRTRRDIDHIAADLQGVNRALIVGGGYIGLETAASLRKKNMEVTVVEAADRILQRVTSPVMSEFFARVHREEGAEIVAGAGVEEFVGSGGRVTGARTTDGELLTAEIVIVGVGVVVNDELARECGLSVDNGVVVDEYCQTDDERILAIGDCTNHYNALYDRRLRLESVPNANDQAKIAAKTICGQRVPYRSLPWFWSEQYDVRLQIAGLFHGYDDIVLRGDATGRSFCAFYLQDGKVIAADAVNSPRDFVQAKQWIQEGAALPEE